MYYIGSQLNALICLQLRCFDVDILEGVDEKDTIAFIEELILKQVISSKR